MIRCNQRPKLTMLRRSNILENMRTKVKQFEIVREESEVENPEELVKRLRVVERNICAEIEVWLAKRAELEQKRDTAKPGREANEIDHRIAAIHKKVDALRREQRLTVTSLLDAEAAIVKLARGRGAL